MKNFREQKFVRTPEGWKFEKEGRTLNMDEKSAKELNDQFEQNGVILAPVDEHGKVIVDDLKESFADEKPAKVEKGEEKKTSTWEKIKSHFIKK